jgi:tol-pal system protein YbgF
VSRATPLVGGLSVRAHAVFVIACAFVASACATKADVQTLESSIVDEMAQIRDDQMRLLEQMQSALDSLDAAEARRASTGQGELDRRVQRLESSLAALMDLAAQNNQLLIDRLDRSAMAGPRPGAPGGMVTPSGDPVGPGGREPGAGDLGADEATQFYALALEEFRKGNYETARGALQEFLAMNPSHDLAPDAQYHIARTYEDAGDVAMALTEYQRVTELYPDSNRAPAALYRRGLIEVGRGNTAIARRLFTQIQNGYPDSPEVPLARQELAKLGG